MLKRLVNLTGSIIARAIDWFVERTSRLFGRLPQPRCVVLAYHSVPATQRTLFVNQMEILLRSAKPVHADIKTLPVQGGRYAAITFDDGLENIVENALPELKQRGIPATLFIVTEMLGCNRTWEHLGGEDISDAKVMSLEQLLEFPSDLVRIGSHSMTHPFLPSVDREKIQYELCGSRTKLEKLLNCEVKLFSFPYGAFNGTLIEDCRKANYGRVFTALPLFAFSEADEFVTGRVGTAPTDWPIEFRLKLAGAYRWLPYAFALKRRILSAIRGRAVRAVGIKDEEKRMA